MQTHWPRMAGRKPDPTTLRAVTKHNLARPNTKNAVALAMMLRPEGTTQGQIAAALGRRNHNKIKQVVRKGRARQVPMPRKQGQRVYKLVLKPYMT